MSRVFRWLSHWPLWALHGLGAVLGWVVFLASAAYRRNLLAHAALAGVSRSDALASVAHAGRMVAELPRLWLGRRYPPAWRVPNTSGRPRRRGTASCF